MEILDLAQGPLQMWLLFALRAMAFLLSAPIFSARFVPLQFRVYLAFLMAVIAFSAWNPQQAAMAMSTGDFVIAGINELLIGLALGTILSLVLLAFQFAGSLAGYQMGLSIVNVLDPSSRQQVSLLGDFLFACATLAFLELNLHHDVLHLWERSLSIAPPGSFALQSGSGEMQLVVSSITDLLLLGLQISMPLVLFLILVDAALGILARVVPQLNIFVIGTTAKTAIGLVLLSLLVLQIDDLIIQPHREAEKMSEKLLRLSHGHKSPEQSTSDNRHGASLSIPPGQ